MNLDTVRVMKYKKIIRKASSKENTMNTNERLLFLLASESDSCMSAQTAHQLISKQGIQLKLSTIQRSLRKLQSGGFVQSTEYFNRKKKRTIHVWSITPEGKMQAMLLR